MLVPVDLVIFIAGLLLTGLGAFFTFAIHLLIRILNTQNRIEMAQSLQAVRMQSLERERETA